MKEWQTEIHQQYTVNITILYVCSTSYKVMYSFTWPYYTVATKIDKPRQKKGFFGWVKIVTKDAIKTLYNLALSLLWKYLKAIKIFMVNGVYPGYGFVVTAAGIDKCTHVSFKYL